MRIKAVSILVGGEILAEPVLTEKNDILIPSGTQIKKEYIPLIESLGVNDIMIEDPYEYYEMPNPIIDAARFDKYVEKVRRLMESHIYHDGKSLKEFEIIANDIVREINEMPADAIVDIKERTSNLYEHTVMVTLLSVMVAKKMKLDDKRKYNIAVGCLLHDIGLRFVVTPYKNRDFSCADAAELFEYKKHTILGYSALEDENWIAPISMKMVLAHHEDLNGTGFPMKQKNKELECKIIQACDAFDCLISGMECRRISVQNAIKVILESIDVKYDKKVVKKLISSIAKYPVGTTVQTTKDDEGVVISQTKDPENPIIMIINANNDNCNIKINNEISNKVNSEETERNKLNLMLEKNISILRVI